MSIKNKCQPKTNVNQKQMSTKIKCQPKSNVNQNQMSTKNKFQPKTNLNQKKMSTKNNCQPKTNVNQNAMSTIILLALLDESIHSGTFQNSLQNEYEKNGLLKVSYTLKP